MHEGMPQPTFAAAKMARAIMIKRGDFTAAMPFLFAGAVGAWVPLTFWRTFSCTAAIHG